MNTSEIYNFLWSKSSLSDFVMMVAPVTILRHIRPLQCSIDSAYIINVRPNARRLNGRVGTTTTAVHGHWVVLIIGPGKNEIFDSLGQTNVSGSTGVYGREMGEFVEENDFSFVNNELLDSKNCGFFCLLFCYYKSRGYSTLRSLEKLKQYRLNIAEKCISTLAS